MRRWLACLAPIVALGALTPLATSHFFPATPTSVAVEIDTKIPERKPEEPKKLDSAALEKLARTDPIAFITAVIERYDREVRGYRVTLAKEERVQGKLLKPEVIACAFREKPFSVLMDWKEGARLASKTLYIKGENKDQLLVLPYGWRAIAGVVIRDPVGADAKSSARYPATEFGIQIGTRRTLAAWQTAKKRGDLKIEFNGVKKLKELNNRPTWELKRTGYPKPEDDGITEATFYFDTETGYQIGSVLTGEKKQLIGTYYFRDLELNPDFDADTFSREAMRKR